MTKEQYESLSLTELRGIAKSRKMTRVSALRKLELIDALLAQDARDTGASGSADSLEAAGQAQAKQAKVRPAAEKPAETAVKQKAAQKSAAAAVNHEPAAEKQEEDKAPRPQQRRMRTSHAGSQNQPSRMSRVSRNNENSRNNSGKPAEARGRRQADRQERNHTDRGNRNERLEQRGDRSQRVGHMDQHSEPNEHTEQRADRTEYLNGHTDRQEQIMERSDEGVRVQQDLSRPQQEADSRVYAKQENIQPVRASAEQYPQEHTERAGDKPPMELSALDSGNRISGVLEVLPEGYGFIRSNNYLPGDNDVYVAPSQIRKFGLRTGDIIAGNTRVRAQQEKFSALLYVNAVNGMTPSHSPSRRSFEDMTPVFPDHRIRMEREDGDVAMRIVDLISPIGHGQRGMIVSQPKAGKTTLLKQIAHSIQKNDPMMHIMIMLIDERPEEVTDIREDIVGERVEVLYSTFDEEPAHHIRVAQMGIERAKRLVEYGENVTILLDSITRLARAANLTVQPSGRTLSGGLDPSALYMPKRFFGAARNMREGGSLTILATALVDTGSKMDDVVYEEFKGTGNMELVLDRKLSERRIFPAINIQASSTRREDLLLGSDEQEAVYIMRRALNGLKGEEATENILNLFLHTRSNEELVARVRRQRFV